MTDLWVDWPPDRLAAEALRLLRVGTSDRAAEAQVYATLAQVKVAQQQMQLLARNVQYVDTRTLR